MLRIKSTAEQYVMCPAQGAEARGHCQEQLQTLIYLKTHLFSFIQKIGKGLGPVPSHPHPPKLL